MITKAEKQFKKIKSRHNLKKLYCIIAHVFPAFCLKKRDLLFCGNNYTQNTLWKFHNLIPLERPLFAMR